MSTLAFSEASTDAKKPSKQEIKQLRLQQASPKSRIWSLELALLNHNQKTASDESMSGKGARVSFGYGVLTRRFLFLGDFSFYLGPFGINYATAKYDNLGSGVSLLVGASLIEGFSLRSEPLGFGILGGIGYQEIRSRYYSRNDIEDPVPASSEGIVTGYSNRSVSIDLNFGVFVSMVKDQRPDTYDTENLVTRNEGLLFSLQGSLPLWSRHYTQYRVLDAGGAESMKKVSGILEGYKIIISMRAFLGT
jgi:hypothetical protein